jgi:hypothetical protein
MIFIQSNDQFTGFICMNNDPFNRRKAGIGQSVTGENDGWFDFLVTEIPNFVDFEKPTQYRTVFPRQLYIVCLKTIGGYLLHAIRQNLCSETGTTN